MSSGASDYSIGGKKLSVNTSGGEEENIGFLFSVILWLVKALNSPFPRGHS